MSLLIDARNAFNKGNRKIMVHIARHELPSCSRFLFNMQMNLSVLVSRGETASNLMFLHSRERITYGFPLAMVACATLMLPLIKLLKKTYLEISLVWHADGGNVVGFFPQQYFFQ